MINQIKKNIKDFLDSKYEGINLIVEEPKDKKMGDLSVPVFPIVKTLKRPLNDVVNEVKELLQNNFKVIKEISNVGGFINIKLNKEDLAFNIIKEVLEKDSHYGESKIGENKLTALDYSSPNIAKSFSIGHLRSTIIGNSLKLINQKCGYKTYAINYLGDWGTQFGKMIVAYNLWADKEKVKEDPINELTKLYVRFHEEAKNNPTLEDEAREAFRKCELKDPEYLKLWEYIKDESLKESEQIYKLLKVDFDSYKGEAFYNDKMEPVVDELIAKKLAYLDDGALIVNLGDDMPPALIKRKDGGSLYMTRDLAALLYRKKVLNFDKILYVVGNEQKLHFEQLKKIIELMGYDFKDEVYHVGFGLYLVNGKKMSTRQGGVTKLYDVLEKAISLALEQINLKNPNLANKEEVATKVGVAAVLFNDLKNHRELNIEFDLNSCVKFEGQTGPYLQYSSVRIASILKNQELDLNNLDETVYDNDDYFDIIKQLSNFTNTIEKACIDNAPSYIAKYLLNLAQSFNKLYSLYKLNVSDDKVRNANFALIKAIRIVINEGLRLLGIDYLNEM